MNRRQLLSCAVSGLVLWPRLATAGLEGKPLPNLSLIDHEGKARELSQFLGDVLLLNFWATWCGPCMAELPELQGLHQQLQGGSGVRILPICLDEVSPPAAVLRMMAARSFTVPILFADAKPAATKLGITSLPTSLIVDRGGTVRYIVEGAQQWANPQWVRGLQQLRG